MIADWPIVVWFLDALAKAFPPARTGQIVEDPDDLGFFWVLDDIEDDMSDFVWGDVGLIDGALRAEEAVWDDTIDEIERKMGLGTYDCDKCLTIVFGDEENDDE